MSPAWAAADQRPRAALLRDGGPPAPDAGPAAAVGVTGAVTRPFGPGTRWRGGPASCAASVSRAGTFSPDGVEGAGRRPGSAAGCTGRVSGGGRRGGRWVRHPEPAAGGRWAGPGPAGPRRWKRSRCGAAGKRASGGSCLPVDLGSEWCGAPRNRPRRTDDSRHATPSGELDARPVGSRVESAVAAEHTTGILRRSAHVRSPSASTAEWAVTIGQRRPAHRDDRRRARTAPSVTLCAIDGHSVFVHGPRSPGPGAARKTGGRPEDDAASHPPVDHRLAPLRR